MADLNPDRARQLDDRPDTTLAGIARDMEAEWYAHPVTWRHEGPALLCERLPTLQELRARRLGTAAETGPNHFEESTNQQFPIHSMGKGKPQRTDVL